MGVVRHRHTLGSLPHMEAGGNRRLSACIHAPRAPPAPLLEQGHGSGSLSLPLSTANTSQTIQSQRSKLPPRPHLPAPPDSTNSGGRCPAEQPPVRMVCRRHTSRTTRQFSDLALL